MEALKLENDGTGMIFTNHLKILILFQALHLQTLILNKKENEMMPMTPKTKTRNEIKQWTTASKNMKSNLVTLSAAGFEKNEE